MDSVSNKQIPILNPATEELITKVSEANEIDVAKAVAAAKDAFKIGSPWRFMDASQRGNILMKLADLMELEKETFSKLETMNQGKPISSSKFEFESCLEHLRYFAGYADKVHGKTIPASGSVFAYTRLEPYGVCALIIPWNYPLLLTIWKLGSALAMGNTVVIKPSEFTPLTVLHLASLFEKAGLPKGVANVVPGYGPIAGEALLKHSDVDKISFTGT